MRENSLKNMYKKSFHKKKRGDVHMYRNDEKKLWTKSSLRKKLFHFTIIPIRWRKFGLGVEDIGEIHGWAQATVHRCANSRIRILQMQMQKILLAILKIRDSFLRIIEPFQGKKQNFQGNFHVKKKEKSDI